MPKHREHKTLVGGSLDSTHYVDQATHVHIHFLDIGRTEVCCHGCGTSIIYIHGKKNPSAIRDILKEPVKAHEKCAIPGVDFERWCPDIRLHVSVVDLTKRTDTGARDTQRQ